MNCPEGTMKYFMIVVNALFVMIGLALILVGALSLTQVGEYQHMLEDGFFSIPALLITIGVFVTVLFFFGCWGLKKESYCFMMTFAVLLGIILVMELIGGISAYVLRDRPQVIFNRTIEKSFNETFNPNSHVFNNTEYRDMWNLIQSDGHCCGLNSYTDYSHIPLDMDYNKTISVPVPASCCNQTDHAPCLTNVTSNLYDQGCGPIIITTVSDVIGAVAKWAVLVAALHLLWIIGACYFAQMFRRQSYESV